MINDNSFQWHIAFSTEFGRKLTTATWMSNLNQNYTKNITKTAEIAPEAIPYLEDGTKTIIDLLTVKNALIEGLTELRDAFFNEMKPVGALKIAKFKSHDVVTK